MDREGSSRFGSGVHFDLALMGFDDLVDDEQSEAKVPPIAVLASFALQAVENATELRGRNRRACIVDRHDDGVRLAVRVDADWRRRVTMLNGVPEQVPESLRETRGVPVAAQLAAEMTLDPRVGVGCAHFSNDFSNHRAD